VQHLALMTDNISHAMAWLAAQGVEVLDTPENYYDMRMKHVPSYGDLIHSLRGSKVFIDQNSDGVLLQAFTKPLQTRATFFVEIIERQGMQGFGSGNVAALFKAMECAQMTRGTL
jgi:4-hydroxyphenylpyruvate dioxygenase